MCAADAVCQIMMSLIYFTARRTDGAVDNNNRLNTSDNRFCYSKTSVIDTSDDVWSEPNAPLTSNRFMLSARVFYQWISQGDLSIYY